MWLNGNIKWYQASETRFKRLNTRSNENSAVRGAHYDINLRFIRTRIKTNPDANIFINNLFLCLMKRYISPFANVQGRREIKKRTNVDNTSV